MRRSLTLLCVLALYTATAETTPPRTATFGEWSTPVNVGWPVNTGDNDNYAVLSRDELTMYFTSDRYGTLGGDDLWFTTRESVDAPWDEPRNMGPVINTIYADSLPVLSSNQHIMYFYSTRPGGCGEGIQGDIWMTRRRNARSAWEEPTNVGCVLNTPATEIAPAFFEDPETEQAFLFYGSNRTGGLGDFDIYVSPLGDHGYAAGSGVLVAELSSAARDTRIFIRKDGLEAFVTSSRAGGLGLDIWVSTRDALSDAWSVPVNLGPPVNSAFEDGSPWLSRDGTTLYFFSARDGGYGKRDIWYTRRIKINHEDSGRSRGRSTFEPRRPRSPSRSRLPHLLGKPDDCALRGHPGSIGCRLVQELRNLLVGVSELNPGDD